jgi:hypothetical protein
MNTKNYHCGNSAIVHSRREFLEKSGFGLGALALADLLARDSAKANDVRMEPRLLAPRKPHFVGQARHVIFLFMTGGPSHMDTFDPKPELQKWDGKPLPDSFKTEGLSLQFMKASDGKLMGSPFPFRPRGSSGVEVSDLFANLGQYADDMAVIRSCHHDSFIHGPALGLLHSGHNPARPSYSRRLGHLRTRL